MHRPDYRIDVMMKAVQAAIEPEVYDDVVVWDDDGYVTATGLLLEKSDASYKVLNYYDKPRVFTWDHAVKIEDTKAEVYANDVDAVMRERMLRRALYKACANWADSVAFEETEGIGYDNSVAEKWRKMERECLKKVEEYK